MLFRFDGNPILKASRDVEMAFLKLVRVSLFFPHLCVYQAYLIFDLFGFAASPPPPLLAGPHGA